MKNYALDTKLLPKVWVTWMNKDGRVFMGENGVRQTYPESWMAYNNYDMRYHGYSNTQGKTSLGHGYWTRNCDKIWVNAGSQLYYAYTKYHEDIDCLELAAVKYDTTRGECNHTWEYAGTRLFINKDKTIEVSDVRGPYETFLVKKGSYFRNKRDTMRAIMRLDVYEKPFLDEFKKFIGNNYFIIGNGTSECIEYPWHLNRWYDTVQKKRTTGKTQKMVDELVKMPLGETSGLAYKYPPKFTESQWRGRVSIDNIIYFERANDKWSVLRAFIRTKDGDLDEGWRVYLGDDGTNRIASKSNGEWIPASQQKGWNFKHQYYFANEDEALEKCNRIKYIMPIVKEADTIDALITTLRFPFIEQLYKMGQKKTALALASSSQPKAYMKDVFGYYNDKEKGVLRQIGMTKHQLDAYCEKRSSERWSYGNDVIELMRETLGNDLSRIDNATFDRYLNVFDSMRNDMWGIRRIRNSEIDKPRFWKNVVRLYEKNDNTVRLISDTVVTYNRFYYGEPVEVDWYFDDYSDIVRTHDALNTLLTEREAERRASWDKSEAERRKAEDVKRQKTDEARKHYEYEDDNFIIRLPKDVYEIIREGSKQSICIGGYTARHSNGDTNLFFLRKKSDEETPFYAIEMNNNKVIVQIHGHSNKWLGNNPEAIPTVVRWLRKNDIKCDNKILTCTARGYGRTNEYIEMPKVD